MNYDMNFIKYLWNKKTSEILIYKISEVFWIEATTRFELVIRVLQTTPLYAKKSHIYRHCSHFSNRRPPYAPPYFSCHYCTPESDLFQTLYPTYMEETWNIN